MSATVIILIVLVVLLVLWGVSIQNKLVRADELTKNALRQINVQQVSRFDALKALVKLTREYAGYESETLEKVIAQRSVVSSANPTAKDVNENQNVLNDLTSKLIAVSERYPDLKASQNYQETMSSLKGYEENVRLARMTYNDTVTKFNNQVRTFPASIVAGMLGFSPKDYLEEDKSKTEYPEI